MLDNTNTFMVTHFTSRLDITIFSDNIINNFKHDNKSIHFHMNKEISLLIITYLLIFKTKFQTYGVLKIRSPKENEQNQDS